MATRGWTSRVASREPQVLRAPCTVIFGTSARVMRRSKLRLKLRGSMGVPWRVVKTRPVPTQAPSALSQSVSCCCLRSLSAVMQVRQRERRLR
jgi:hypothetical protein